MFAGLRHVHREEEMKKKKKLNFFCLFLSKVDKLHRPGVWGHFTNKKEVWFKKMKNNPQLTELLLSQVLELRHLIVFFKRRWFSSRHRRSIDGESEFQLLPTLNVCVYTVHVKSKTGWFSISGVYSLVP